jgi:NADH-ubiquinone oxidoreductase chain 4
MFPTLLTATSCYIIAFFLLQSILFGVFFSLDLIVFYLLFEAVLIPMFLIVGIYGSRQRRIRSAYLLFLYTLFSSLFMFLSILYIFFNFGTTDYLILKTVNFGSFIEKLC